MIKNIRISCVVLSLIINLSLARNSPPDRDNQPLQKPQNINIDDYWHYHNVGNIGMTVTNYGLLGQGYQTALQDQPSCQYKYKSNLEKERVEHFSYAGLWFGGKGGMKGEQRTLVSTAIVDGVFEYGEAGFEFTNSADEDDVIRERSSIITSPLFDPQSISHQDFVCDFTDKNTEVPTEGSEEIPLIDHTPLGVNVHLETYAWNYAYADAFVILNYTFTNISNYPIEDIYVGLWVDASVANMNYTSNYEPGGGFTWYDNLNGFDREYNMGYQFDVDGDNGYAESYLGIRPLGASVPTSNYQVHYDQWQWSNTSLPDFFMPSTDQERYTKLSTTPSAAIPSTGDDQASWMLLVSFGPLGDLQPGDTLNAVFAVVCGFWEGSGGDSPNRRKNLRVNSDWAQIAYNGEDVNGDGILDPSEDVNGNGIIDRYILPSAPPSPNLLVVPEDRKATLYWDNLPEEFKDPITQEKDFEGYRIYGSPKTVNSEDQMTLLAQFDNKDSLAYGYDTGFDPVRCDTVINGKRYHYKFVNENLHNGWPGKYFYSVTAYDRGNPDNNLPSLESSVFENLTYAIVGKTPAGDAGQKVYVYPNPYKANAMWDGFGSRDRLIWFANLPERSTIRIFTLAGDLVQIIDHNAATYNGADTRLLKAITDKRNTVFSGGEHAWDLISQNDQAIATGLYLFTVTDEETGDVYRGKFLVIK